MGLTFYILKVMYVTDGCLERPPQAARGIL